MTHSYVDGVDKDDFEKVVAWVIFFLVLIIIITVVCVVVRRKKRANVTFQQGATAQHVVVNQQQPFIE